MPRKKQKIGRKGGQSSHRQSKRGWFGDPEGHAEAGRQSSGNRKINRGEEEGII